LGEYNSTEVIDPLQFAVSIISDFRGSNERSLVIFCVAIVIALIVYSQRTTIASRLAERVMEA